MPPGRAASLSCRNQKGLPDLCPAQWTLHPPAQESSLVLEKHPALPEGTPFLNTIAPSHPSLGQGYQAWQMKMQGTQLDVNSRLAMNKQGMNFSITRLSI